MHNINDISLALSGGGVRAIAFHCGVLRYLAEQKKLEHITHISSVSGGSLLVGLIFSLNSMSWPSSQSYLDNIAPKIRNILLTKDLQNESILNLLKPTNWRYFFSRANILSKTINNTWNITAKAREIPDYPVWSINGTTAETGKRFRFKHKDCGDYLIGYNKDLEFSLADLMAISAAFPVGIGPFVIKNIGFERYEGDRSFDLPSLPNFKKIHIYDGGIYDNLGMESFFDIGAQKLKNDCKFLIVSDAGLKLDYIKLKNIFHPLRAKRIADIALDQNRALRVRAFTNFIRNNKSKGLYVQIGSSPKKQIEKFFNCQNPIHKLLLNDHWLSTEKCKEISNYATNLKILSVENFDEIFLHGYETIKWNKNLSLNN